MNGDDSNKTSTDTTPIPMELEADTNVQHHTNNISNETSSNNPQAQVDLETELREFLEAGNNGLPSTDDVAIEQMLLD